MEDKIKVDALKFRSGLIDQIIEGVKNNTWRVWSDEYIVVGDEIDLINSDTDKVFARAQIIEKCEKSFADLNSNEKEGHEKFDSEEEMYQYYSEYYKIPVDENTSVTVIKFQIIN